MEYKKIRAIISGGGTGGHIFPALSIANKLKELNPETEILFVGAEGRMEMEKVPAAGYEIKALPIAGLQRKFSLKNLALPFKVIKSVSMAKKIIRKFKPDVAIGVGGYASAPVLLAAQSLNIPTLIQEQNGFAGLTNKIIAKKAKTICVAYEGMERFFPSEKIVMSGNPIRKEIVPADEAMKSEAMNFYQLDPQKKHILIVGGSLGCRTLNDSVMKWIEESCPQGEDIQIIWQCGKYYLNTVREFMSRYPDLCLCSNNDSNIEESHKDKKYPKIQYSDFIKRMDLAYAAADLVISRSGASSVSELCAAHKAVILVPSPFVTEDHQTHNAMALVKENAGILIKDAEARDKLMKVACELVHDEKKISQMEKNIEKMALTNASEIIAEEIYKII